GGPAGVRPLRGAHHHRGVRVLPAGGAHGGRRARARRARAPGPGPPGPEVGCVSRPFAPGEQVLLVDAKKRRYLVRLEPGGEFHTHAGVIAHDEIIGATEGTRLRSSRGATMLAIRPTLAEFVLKMP